MNAPRDLGPEFRAWLADVPPMPLELPARTLEATRHTPQRRRWLWFLPGLKPTAGADGRDGRARQSTTIPRNGGTSSMFSATKLLAVAASVSLFGALTLGLPLGRQQDPVTPGAAVPSLGQVTSFTGEMEILGKDQLGTPLEVDGGSGRTGEQWTSRLTTTDERYSGLVTGFHDYHQLESGGAFVRVHMSRQFTDEPDGTWLSTGYGYLDPTTTGVTYVTRSTGEGLYEGLSAMAICEQTYGAMEMACHGIIFEGQWPELPADAPGEIPARYIDS